MNLDKYINKIFCYRNVGSKKPGREFYSKVISELGIDPARMAMVVIPLKMIFWVRFTMAYSGTGIIFFQVKAGMIKCILPYIHWKN